MSFCIECGRRAIANDLCDKHFSLDTKRQAPLAALGAHVLELLKKERRDWHGDDPAYGGGYEAGRNGVLEDLEAMSLAVGLGTFHCRTGCLNCGSENVEWCEGDYPSGVTGPDGAREILHEGGYACGDCGAIEDRLGLSADRNGASK